MRRVSRISEVGLASGGVRRLRVLLLVLVLMGLAGASFLGVHSLAFDQGRWNRTLVVKGDPAVWPKSGSSDVAG